MCITNHAVPKFHFHYSKSNGSCKILILPHGHGNDAALTRQRNNLLPQLGRAMETKLIWCNRPEYMYNVFDSPLLAEYKISKKQIFSLVKCIASHSGSILHQETEYAKPAPLPKEAWHRPHVHG